MFGWSTPLVMERACYGLLTTCTLAQRPVVSRWAAGPIQREDCLPWTR